MNGECDYPSNTDTLNRIELDDHPIQCATCELVAQALENWMIDPTDEQAVRIFEVNYRNNFTQIIVKYFNLRKKINTAHFRLLMH